MRRYPALRFIANIYKILAYVIAAVAVVGIVISLSCTKPLRGSFLVPPACSCISFDTLSFLP